MKRSMSETQVENRKRVALSLEPLEPRVLLSGEAVVSLAVSPAWFATVPDAYTPGSPIEQYGTAEVAWQGQSLEAVKDQWVVQFAEDALDGIGSVADTAGLLAGGLPFQVVQGLGLTGQVLIRTAGASTASVESWLSANPNVAAFSPDVVLQSAAVPNDPYLVQLWGLNNIGQYAGVPGADIDALAAWDLETGSSSIVVAVIDTGVDYTHPDLAGNMWVNALEFGGTAAFDDDANGFIDDIYGYDFYADDGDPMDVVAEDGGHGTHVAGTIGGVGNNSIGVVGVNWDVSIMALRFLGVGGGTTADAIAAVNYATMMRNEYVDGAADGTPGADVRVTNNSWGGGAYDAGLYSAIQASGTAGILFVAAAGNDTSDNDFIASYPNGYDLPNIISVAATTPSDTLASFSNWGRTTVDLGAPGEFILSTMPGASYGIIAGTSMAAPHVTGVAALAWAYNPSATMEEVKEAILAGAEPVPALAGLTVTGARLNALGTLQRIVQPDPTFVEVGAWASGAAEVTLYDTAGTLDVMPTDVAVLFGGGNSVKSITAVGGGDGIGLVISGASSVGKVTDVRTSEPLSFLASDASIKSIETKWGFSGANLNGGTLGHSGGLTFAADIDGDGLTNDWNALYTEGSLTKASVGMPVEGDVYVGANLGKFAVAALGGDLNVVGTTKDAKIGASSNYDFTFGGAVTKLLIDGAFSGGLYAGASVKSAQVEGDLSGAQVKVASVLGTLGVKGNVLPALVVDPVTFLVSQRPTTILAPAMTKVGINGNIEDSFVLAGTDLGADWAVGGIGADADTYMPGTIGNVTIKGTSTESYIAAGLTPIFGSLEDGLLGESFLFGSLMKRVEVWGAISGLGGVGSYQIKSAGFVRIPDPSNPLRPNEFTFTFDKTTYPFCFWII